MILVSCNAAAYTLSEGPHVATPPGGCGKKGETFIGRLIFHLLACNDYTAGRNGRVLLAAKPIR
jgi:hypothetical protein